MPGIYIALDLLLLLNIVVIDIFQERPYTISTKKDIKMTVFFVACVLKQMFRRFVEEATKTITIRIILEFVSWCALGHKLQLNAK